MSTGRRPVPLAEPAAALAWTHVGLWTQSGLGTRSGAALGAGGHRRCAREGLAPVGAGGPCDRHAPRTVYDADGVHALTDWPTVDRSRLTDICPHGLYVARLSRAIEVDLTQGWHAVAAQVDAMPAMPGLTAATLGVRVNVWLQVPWVATVSGFVVFGAELVGFREQTEPIPRTFFVLRPPGAWFGAIEGRRLPTRPGGRPRYLWTPPACRQPDQVRPIRSAPTGSIRLSRAGVGQGLARGAQPPLIPTSSRSRCIVTLARNGTCPWAATVCTSVTSAAE